MDKRYLETAVTLARMYGVAETLHPWENRNSEDFICIIKEWTDEFLSREDADILTFFESKVK